MVGPLMIDIESDHLIDDDKVVIANKNVGGVIFFSRNFVDVSQMADLCESIRQIKSDILIAVDHEGGRVQRFNSALTDIPAMGEISHLAKAQGLTEEQLFEDAGWMIAAEIAALGLDISFTPVLDINRGNSQIIGNRGFADNAQEIIKFASAFMAGLNLAGMHATGKHFPGHGGVATDSHLELPEDTRSTQLIAEDLFVFKKLIHKLEGIMPAHVLYKEFDDKNPAGFSSYWLQQILRKELGFKGVIFSDDLSMKGAAAFGNYVQRTQKALQAGCDMVLICNDRKAVHEVLESGVFKKHPISDISQARIESMRFSGSDMSIERLRKTQKWLQIRRDLGTE